MHRQRRTLRSINGGRRTKTKLQLKFSWNAEYKSVWKPETIGMESRIHRAESGI